MSLASGGGGWLSNGYGRCAVHVHDLGAMSRSKLKLLHVMRSNSLRANRLEQNLSKPEAWIVCALTLAVFIPQKEAFHHRSEKHGCSACNKHQNTNVRMHVPAFSPAHVT